MPPHSDAPYRSTGRTACTTRHISNACAYYQSMWDWQQLTFFVKIFWERFAKPRAWHARFAAAFRTSVYLTVRDDGSSPETLVDESTFAARSSRSFPRTNVEVSWARVDCWAKTVGLENARTTRIADRRNENEAFWQQIAAILLSRGSLSKSHLDWARAVSWLRLFCS